MKYFRRYRGESTAAGMVTMFAEPDFSMGEEKFTAWLGTMGVKRFDLQVDTLTGTVLLEGCNGRPDVAGEWYTLGTLSGDGKIELVDIAADFIRVNKSIHTSGTVVCMLTMSG